MQRSSAVEGTPSRGMAADQHTIPDIAALRKLEASVHLDLLEQAAVRARRTLAARRPDAGATGPHLLAAFADALLGALAPPLNLAPASVAGMVLLGMLALWWRLGSGPIDFDFATPWLAAAIEENFGSNHRIVVGGTQLERDASGRTALRIRDIIVRDAHGEIVASAPKAEVSFSGTGLMTGRVRAKRLSLVGAEMQVRIEPDSKVTVFAGTNRQPFVTASVTEPALRAGVAPNPMMPERAPAPQVPGSRATIPDLAALLAWIDSLGATGLDGRDLSELGLKNGNLTLFDQRNGKQWEFHDINLSLTRPSGGGVCADHQLGGRRAALAAARDRLTRRGRYPQGRDRDRAIAGQGTAAGVAYRRRSDRAQHSDLRPRARVDRRRRHSEDDRGPDRAREGIHRRRR